MTTDPNYVCSHMERPEKLKYGQTVRPCEPCAFPMTHRRRGLTGQIRLADGARPAPDRWQEVVRAEYGKMAGVGAGESSTVELKV
jgi:hypothetical protein